MKRSYTGWLILGIALVVLGVYVGVSRGWDYTPGDRDTETAASYAAGEIAAVSIQTRSLEVRVYDGWEDVTVEVPQPAAKRITAERRGDVLYVTEGRASWLYRLLHPREGYMILWLPAEYGGSLQVETVSGEVVVSGVGGGEASVTTVSGDGSLYDAAFDTLTVATTSGDIYLGNVTAGRAELGTVSGDILCTGLDMEELGAETVSGDVWAELAGEKGDYAIALSTVSGDIYGVRESTGGERALTVQTVSGDIQIEFER